MECPNTELYTNIGVRVCAVWLFLPGDKIVVVGTRTGELELFDIASSTLIDTVQAHEGPVWTLQVHPDGRSVVTGSADKALSSGASRSSRRKSPAPNEPHLVSSSSIPEH
jgi:WD40 repeat protein